MTATGSELVIAGVVAGYVLILIGVLWGHHRVAVHRHERWVEHRRFMDELEHYRRDPDTGDLRSHP